MKLSTKMILIFSFMILMIVTINTAYLSQTNIRESDASTTDRYRNMAANMIGYMEQYVTMMDLAIEDFTSDTAFMEAFYQVATEGDSAASLPYQNRMFQTLYHSPLADSFYRVSVFSENGFFMSNHIDRNDSIVSMSDESMEMIAAIPYLRAVKAAPYRRHLIGPHRDYFSVSRRIMVFSAVRTVMWHGKHVGYIEVSASTEELDNLLLADNENVMIRAMLSSGEILYASPEDEAVYADIPLDQFTSYTDPTGLERNVYHAESRWLGLDIFLSEDAAIRIAKVQEMAWGFFQRSLLIAAIAMVLVIIVSLGITEAIRRLSRRMRALPVESLMHRDDTTQLESHVTSPRDKELYELESTCNQLLLALHETTRNELTLRETNLRSRLVALQAQINPHFVYNTLNVIAAKGMESGNEEIIDMCEQFGLMLRYSTDTHSDSATLQDELNHVENYLRLLKARYEDQLTFSIDVPEMMNHYVIPKLTLQPIVENAVTHGFDRESDRVRCIEIHGTLDQDQLWLEIHDNGRGFSPDVLERLRTSITQISENSPAPMNGQGHIGLLNTCMRLHYYSKGTMRMTLLNDNGAVVRLSMPIKD